ncbi:MAG: hypothetical protein CYG59_25370 [Chloroflexi bacterium]|nr:MAG: hypothetical protein CYG59_25370 [Chloroflexota bacterium]
MAAHQSLDSAIQALRNGDRDTARELLQQLTEAEPLLPEGWLWLAAASDNAEAKLAHLRQAQSLKPHDRRIVAGLRAMDEPGGAPMAAGTPAGEAHPDVRFAPPVVEAQPINVASAPAPAAEVQPASVGATSPAAGLPNPLAMPRFVATGVHTRRPIPWSLVALVCVVVLLIPLTFWLI